MKKSSLLILLILLTAPLWSTPEEDFLLALRESRLRDAAFFTESGYSIDKYLEDGKTALIIMCDEQRSREVRWLVMNGAEPDKRDSAGLTPLMHAALRGDRNILQILVQAGAEVNLQSPEGYTALQYAVNAGWREASIALEEWGGIIVQPYYNHPMLSEVWTRRQHYSRALSLKETRWRHHGFLEVLLEGDYRGIKKMLDDGYDPDAADTEDLSALMLSASLNDFYISKLLLESGADPLLKDTLGLDALWYAAFSGNRELTEYLIEKGAADDSPYLENSPLFAAFISGSHSIMEYLLESGWKGDLTGRIGSTLVHYAAFYADLRTLKLLKEAGYSLSVTDADGRSALDYLIRGYHLNEEESRFIPIAQYLKDQGVPVTTDKSILDNRKLSRIIYSRW